MIRRWVRDALWGWGWGKSIAGSIAFGWQCHLDLRFVPVSMKEVWETYCDARLRRRLVRLQRRYGL